MINIFSSSSVKSLDRKEVELEKITSFDLMKRASNALYTKIAKSIKRASKNIIILATGGNNGGDALCVAEMLADVYNVVVFYIKASKNESEDFQKAYKSLKSKTDIIEINSLSKVEILRDYITLQDVTIIDGLLGSGINRVVEKESLLGKVIDFINENRDLKSSLLISIDLPSGLLGEDNLENNENRSIIKADKTICLQYPKLSTLMPESEEFVGDLCHVDFGMKLMKESKGDLGSMLEKRDIAELIKPRKKHGHKGTFGKGLLIAGCEDMPGACMLSAGASLRGGLGLLYVLTHETVKPHLMNYLPEAICITESSQLDSLLSSCNAVAIGSGLGKKEYGRNLVREVLKSVKQPIVLDADALNIISEDKELLKSLPHKAIITPHPAEFQRLFGKVNSRIEMISKQQEMSKLYDIIIVLKGAYTTITDGKEVIFNSTGNSGMGTAGSGDVLTGMILSLLSQGYDSFSASKIGVYLHGLSGDIAAKELSEYSVIASDIIKNIGEGYKEILE